MWPYLRRPRVLRLFRFVNVFQIVDWIAELDQVKDWFRFRVPVRAMRFPSVLLGVAPVEEHEDVSDAGIPAFVPSSPYSWRKVRLDFSRFFKFSVNVLKFLLIERSMDGLVLELDVFKDRDVNRTGSLGKVLNMAFGRF